MNSEYMNIKIPLIENTDGGINATMVNRGLENDSFYNSFLGKKNSVCIVKQLKNNYFRILLFW